jgi:hypothetical protein
VSKDNVMQFPFGRIVEAPWMPPDTIWIGPPIEVTQVVSPDGNEKLVYEINPKQHMIITRAGR